MGVSSLRILFDGDYNVFIVETDDEADNEGFPLILGAGLGFLVWIIMFFFLRRILGGGDGSGGDGDDSRNNGQQQQQQQLSKEDRIPRRQRFIQDNLVLEQYDTETTTDRNLPRDDNDEKDNPSDDNDEHGKESCPICLEEYQKGHVVCRAKSQNCAHVFHHACAMEWFLKHAECPYCRCLYLSKNNNSNKDIISLPTTTTTATTTAASSTNSTSSTTDMNEDHEPGRQSPAFSHQDPTLSSSSST